MFNIIKKFDLDEPRQVLECVKAILRSQDVNVTKITNKKTWQYIWLEKVRKFCYNHSRTMIQDEQIAQLKIDTLNLQMTCARLEAEKARLEAEKVRLEAENARLKTDNTSKGCQHNMGL